MGLVVGVGLFWVDFLLGFGDLSEQMTLLLGDGFRNFDTSDNYMITFFVAQWLDFMDTLVYRHFVQHCGYEYAGRPDNQEEKLHLYFL